MKTIVMYYTFGGSSKREAEKIANDIEGAILCQVKEKKKRNIFTAFLSGCPKAMKRSGSDIQTVQYNLSDFDKIILVAPVWAGFPVPAFNSMVQLLPEGKEVELYICSGGGETPKSKDGTCQLITDKKCKLVEYHDVKTS